jgi:hypothetical protein
LAVIDMGGGCLVFCFQTNVLCATHPPAGQVSVIVCLCDINGAKHTLPQGDIRRESG